MSEAMSKELLLGESLLDASRSAAQSLYNGRLRLFGTPQIRQSCGLNYSKQNGTRKFTSLKMGAGNFVSDKRRPANTDSTTQRGSTNLIRLLSDESRAVRTF
jgi:hypothetical protein